MNGNFFDRTRALAGRRMLASCAVLLSMTFSLPAAGPSWWGTRGVLKANATVDDYAVANVGQLKHLALKARDEMNANLVGGAGPDIEGLITPWLQSGTNRDDYAAVNLGQLKRVAKLFYNRLAAAGVGTLNIYPWTNSANAADDYALANLGQLKRVFSFAVPFVDTDGDGLPDAWEMQMFGSLGKTAAEDFDNDGLTNLQEWQLGSRPDIADTDWDGYTDAQESLAGTSTTSSQSNPGTNPAPTGPLNPDARYRYGIRLDYAGKYMWASYDGVVGMGNNNPDYHHNIGTAYAFGASSSSIYPYLDTSSYVGDKTSVVFDLWDAAAYPAATSGLFGANSGGWWLTSYLQLSKTTLTTGEIHYGNGMQHEALQVTAVASPGAPSWARRSYALLLYADGGFAPADVVAAGRVTQSALNVSFSDEIKKHVKPGTSGQAVITPWIDPNPADTNPAANVEGSLQNFNLRLLDVDIEPDANMAGVIGDVVKSVKEDSAVRHFVTPKAQPDYLPQPYVELKAGTVSASVFSDLFEWEGGVQGTGTDSNKCKVSRASAGVTTVKIKSKKTKTVVSEMKVWVVWATCTPVLKTAHWDIQQIPTGKLYLFMGTLQPEMANGGRKWFVENYSGTRHRFVFSIQPSSLFDDKNDERPDLKGAKLNDAPGNGNLHSTNPANGPADHAAKKWDVSRQMKIIIRNPYGITSATVGATYGTWFANSTTPSATPVPWPANHPAEGNDDPPGMDEDDNPYDAKSGDDLDHAIGQLSSIDTPSFPVFDSWASQAGYFYTFGVEANFREFCRLEINDGTRATGGWFRISDFYEWHHYLHAQWDGLEWINAGCSWGSGNPIP